MEEERSGEKESFGGSGRRSNGRSDGRSLRAQTLLTGRLVVAGPTTTPVEAEEIVAAGATVALHVSRPRQALLGPRRFASIDNFGVPIVGPLPHMISKVMMILLKNVFTRTFLLLTLGS